MYLQGIEGLGYLVEVERHAHVITYTVTIGIRNKRSDTLFCEALQGIASVALRSLSGTCPLALQSIKSSERSLNAQFLRTQ